MLEVDFECKSVEDIKREAYEKGVNDALDAVHKIEYPSDSGGYRMDVLEALFPDRTGHGFILQRVENAYSPMAIVSIVQDYEENKKKLHAGDVVFGSCKGIVTKISRSNPDKCYILWKDGSSGEWDIENIIKHKTREHLTIPEFWEKYGGKQND